MTFRALFARVEALGLADLEFVYDDDYYRESGYANIGEDLSPLTVKEGRLLFDCGPMPCGPWIGEKK